MKAIVLLLGLAPAAMTAGEHSANTVAPESQIERAPVETAPLNQSDVASGQVINPDFRCADEIVVADGNEDSAELQREPAGPTPPPLHYAVDYEIGGCDVLLATSGEVQPLPALPDQPRVIPAQ